MERKPVSRIFIVGSGVVGSATGRALLQAGHRVTFVDDERKRVGALAAEGLDARTTLDLDGEPESFVFLCLPTPIDPPGGGYRLTAIEAGAEHIGRALASADARHTVVVRSAVPPGTTEELVRPLVERYSAKREGAGFSLAASPLFLRPSPTGQDDYLRRPRLTVIGARSQRVVNRLRELLGPLGGQIRVVDDPATAELIKCTDSLFNATKISFWNEIWQVCGRLGLDPDQVAGAVATSAEGSFNPQYGTRGGAPYAGGRLPRDTRGFLDFAAELGLAMPLLSAVVGVNTEFEWRMAAELDGVSALSAIPRSRPELFGEPDGAEDSGPRRSGPPIPRQLRH
jgi:UDPglucose 6-dehydrogenase